MLPRKMSVEEYKTWIKSKQARDASLPNFFNGGVERTINVLEGDATQASVNKWRSFGARHYAQQQQNPTYRRSVALRNWGYAVPIIKKK